MPKLNPATEKKKAQQLTKAYIQNNFNQSEVARQKGVTRGVINRQINKPIVQATILEELEKAGLTNAEDASDLARLRKAQKLHVCDIYVKDNNGKLKINKNSNDFIEVDDNQTQIKALELTAKYKKQLNGNQPLVDQSQHFYINLDDRALIEQARKRGLNIPDAIRRRIGAASSQQRA